MGFSALWDSGAVWKVEKGDLGKAMIMKSALYEVMIEGTKIELSRGPLWSHRFKDFTQDVDVAQTMVRIKQIDAIEDRTRIEMRGVKEEVSECKEWVEKLMQWMKVIEWRITG